MEHLIVDLQFEASATYLARTVASQVSNQVGEAVLMPRQIRKMAFLLDYKEPEGIVVLHGVTDQAYDAEVKPTIPLEARVDLNSVNITRTARRLYREAYKVTAVEEAFRRLGEQGKIDYSPQRFREALKKV